MRGTAAILMVLLATAFGAARAEIPCSTLPGKVSLADNPWPPFTLGEEGGRATGGRTLTLLRSIFGSLGTSIDVRLYPWQRVLKMAEAGRIDGIPILMRSPEREKYLTYTDRLITVHNVFYFNREKLGAFEWRTFDDLRGYTIGLVTGYTYQADFLAAIGRLGLQVEYSRSPETSYNRLYAGRVDLVIDEEIAGNAMIANHPDWRRAFAKASKPTASYDYFMAFSKRSPFAACVPRINAVIRALSEAGRIDRILKEPARETSP